jgi:aminoglycoside 3-N-acetyltransferase
VAGIGTAEIAAAFGSLAAAGQPVCVHASLRSFGFLAAGPDTVVDGALAAGATLMVPTASFRTCLAPPPPGVVRPFNAEDDGMVPAASPQAWDPCGDFVDPAMGALPAAVLRRGGRARGNHPLTSFTALGLGAAVLVGGQRPLDVYAPLRALASAGGLVVGMGVGLTAMTLIHLAERRAGLRLLRRWAVTRDGLVECEHGGCSRGFERLADALAGVETTLTVGASRWRAWPAAALLDRVTDVLRRDPSAATCAVPGCARCRDLVAAARAGYHYPPEEA